MRWIAKPNPNQRTVQNLKQELNIPESIAHLLAQRGIDTFEKAKFFFRPQLSDLHDPFLMRDMDKAVKRIKEAIANQEKVMVYGDYDVDGTTSVALVVSYLKKKLDHVEPYIPDRSSEGYGISMIGIDRAHNKEIQLIIALDCGIKAIEQIEYANKLGIDFIICDHHLPSEKLPEAIAVLDPKRNDCSYPYKELCGCGIGLKLIQALMETMGNGVDDLLTYLDLVAIAIAADIVPITGENRVLCFYGLKQINASPRHGIRFFLKSLNKKISVSDLVFVIAPRINAAGRMQHGLQAVELLTATSSENALPIARTIEFQNTERKSTDKQITDEALAQIEDLKETGRFSSVVFHPDWHKGVIGIVASRLVENHYRPTVVVTQSEDVLVGSVRSVSGFDVYKALEACEKHLIQFGGHKYAAGLTMKKEQYEAFKATFENAVQERILPEQREPSLYYDHKISFSSISLKLHRTIDQMAPFGPQNMKPVFKTSHCIDTGDSRVVGSDKTHLQLEIKDPSGVATKGIGFGLAHYLSIVKSQQPFSILYNIGLNEFNGNTSLQLVVKDIIEKDVCNKE